MAELDLRKNYLHQPGWPINNLSLEEMVYRLITVIGSSQFLYDNFNEDEYFLIG